MSINFNQKLKPDELVIKPSNHMVLVKFTIESELKNSTFLYSDEKEMGKKASVETVGEIIDFGPLAWKDLSSEKTSYQIGDWVICSSSIAKWEKKTEETDAKGSVIKTVSYRLFWDTDILAKVKQWGDYIVSEVV